MSWNIFTSASTPPSLNQTYLCLIPKFPNANHFKNFRPIGLSNTIYKIITKIIVNRLKLSLDDLISPFQSSFITGRRSIDNCVIIQEIINYLNMSSTRNGSFMVKIDLANAYDKLEWSFIFRTFKYFKFPPNITNLMMSCVSSSTISVLVNGIKTDFFSPSKGIR